MGTFIISLSVAAGLIILGQLIATKKWSFLIAGFNTSSKEEKEKYDEDALCEGMRKLLFLLGGITFISSLGILFEVSWIIRLSWILYSVIIIGFVIYANTGNRYKKG